MKQKEFEEENGNMFGRNFEIRFDDSVAMIYVIVVYLIGFRVFRLDILWSLLMRE